MGILCNFSVHLIFFLSLSLKGKGKLDNTDMYRNFWKPNQENVNTVYFWAVRIRMGKAWEMKRKIETERDSEEKSGNLMFSLSLFFPIWYFPLMFDFYMATMVITPLSSLNILSSHLFKTEGETFHLAIVLGNNYGHIAPCNGMSLIHYLCLPCDKAHILHVPF